jgi:DNA-binding response OmpR family regulator
VTKLLLAEDDPGISEPLMKVLTREGYDVELASNGRLALERAVADGVDLVILDLGLPDLDGIEVCKALRRNRADVRILMLTARTDEIDKVVGLDVGADDYVTKPFALAELLARVRALVRRDQPRALEANGIKIDPGARRAWLKGEELDLTLKEFDLLALLIDQAGSVVPREQIMTEVWDDNWYGSTKTLDMHISALRRKLGDDPAQPKLLSTVRGVGYRFEIG